VDVARLSNQRGRVFGVNPVRQDWELAVRRGDAAAVAEMIARDEGGAGDQLNSQDQHGQTALMLAAKAGHRDVVEVLLRHRAELNHAAKFNLSALMLAVINNQLEIVTMLAAAGADRNIRGTGAPGFHQKTALDLALAAGRVEIVQALSDTGD
jgi:ankyrin repeat protein